MKGKRAGALAFLALVSSACNGASTGGGAGSSLNEPSQSAMKFVAMGGGSESGGGGDTKPLDFGAAWFLGGAPIRYCIQVAPGFGAQPDVVNESLMKALSTWKAYIERKRLNVEVGTEGRLADDYVEQSQCDGSEDIAFYFGVTSPRILDAAKEYFQPIAFAHRNSYDVNAGRGKGFVWVGNSKASGYNPDLWHSADNLVGILLHELGHTYGCDHVDGTIMDSNIAGMLQSGPNPGVTEIDGRRELLLYSFGFYTDFTYKGVIADEWFQKLAGRPSKGSVSATLSAVSPNGVMQYTLVLTDSTGSVELGPSFIDGADAIRFKTSEQIFRKTNAAGATWFNPSGSVSIGTLTGKDSKSNPVVLERNTYGNYEDSPISISVLNGARKIPIFWVP